MRPKSSLTLWHGNPYFFPEPNAVNIENELMSQWYLPYLCITTFNHMQKVLFQPTFHTFYPTHFFWNCCLLLLQEWAASILVLTQSKKKNLRLWVYPQFLLWTTEIPKEISLTECILHKSLKKIYSVQIYGIYRSWSVGIFLAGVSKCNRSVLATFQTLE